MNSSAAVRALLADVQPSAEHLADLVMQIASVPAPTGQETARSKLLADLWQVHGLVEVSRDDLGNVTGTLRGDGSGPCLLAVANMDYAYPAAETVAPHLTGSRIVGSGVYDNTAGLVVLLGTAAVLADSGVRLPGDVIFAATVGEEWGSNCVGMQAVMDGVGARAAAVLNVGHDLANVHHEALGATTVRVDVAGPGGHSYGNLGAPSAVHVLVSALHDVIAIPLPRVPKTSLNVGVIEGGTSGNGIAEHASAVIEIRSQSGEVMDDIETRTRQILAEAATANGVVLDWADLDRRPYGSIPRSHALVKLVAEAHVELGIGVVSEQAAADFNIPLARGIPAVVTGAATGGGVKSAAEYLETASLVTGVQSLMLALAKLMDHTWPGPAAAAPPSDLSRTTET